MDAIALLKADHEVVKRLFLQFEKLGEGAGKARRKIVDRIVRELSIHASIEETLFYPAVRASAKAAGIDEASDLVLESLEEHHIVKWTLAELQKMSAADERFEAKVTVLIESVRHHVEEEEHDLFPMVRRMFAREELRALGAAMEQAKKLAPTRPHPRAPDQPPANLISGPASAVLDRGFAAVKRAAARMRGARPGESLQ